MPDGRLQRTREAYQDSPTMAESFKRATSDQCPIGWEWAELMASHWTIKRCSKAIELPSGGYRVE